MSLTRALALSLAVATLAVPTSRALQAQTPGGDPVRGKIVFRTVGGCVPCHGWASDGKSGVNIRAPTGPSLRETLLDVAGLTEVIRCGRPGTPMPSHDRKAYRDDFCHGLVLADFAAGTEPKRGKTMSEKDIANLVAYLRADVIGRGAPTFEECTAFFDNPAAKACQGMK